MNDLTGDGSLNKRTEICKSSYPVIRNYSLCFDIGANVGGFSNAWWKKFDQVVAIEAHPETFKFAFKNLSKFGNIEVINKAVGAKENEYLTFYPHLNGDSGSTSCKITTNQDLKSGIDVETVSFKSLVSVYGTPEYIKIDCEGSEYDFLIGQDLSGVKFMAIELHYDFLTDAQRKELLEYLMTYFDIYKHRKGAPGVCHDEYCLISREKNK